MKLLITLSLIILATMATHAQKKMFIRVFNEEGKKTHKGFIHEVSDSSLTLSTEQKGLLTIPISQITTLKLKRSFGHVVLITTAITAGSAAVLGAASADPDAWIFAYTAGEGIAMGLLAGSAAGIALGSVISGTINRPVFNIGKKIENWNVAKDVLTTYVPRVRTPDQAMIRNY